MIGCDIEDCQYTYNKSEQLDRVQVLELKIRVLTPSELTGNHSVIPCKTPITIASSKSFTYFL